MNEMNLQRLKSRSASSWITPGLATLGGLLTLAPFFRDLSQNYFLKPLLFMVPNIALDYLKLLLAAALIGVIVGGSINALMSYPRIGIVKAAYIGQVAQ